MLAETGEYFSAPLSRFPPPPPPPPPLAPHPVNMAEPLIDFGAGAGGGHDDESSWSPSSTPYAEVVEPSTGGTDASASGTGASTGASSSWSTTTAGASSGSSGTGATGDSNDF